MALTPGTSDALKSKRSGTSAGSVTVEVTESSENSVTLKVLTATGRGAKLIIAKGPELELISGHTLTISAL